MNEPDRHLLTVFGEALERPVEERAAYLEGACGPSGPLRARVEALLEAHQQAGRFLAGPPQPAPELTVDEPVRERPGGVIGPFKLLEQIGEGGFGVVYLAEQTEPVRRKVALKVLKPGMDTKQVVARFEAERQALALMDHPNISRVFDGGATAEGRPYFVMELVRGLPITDYCDQNNLPVRERLELFADVCSAVQHAHQKGVIHRDIKPSNVLISSHDGKPVVKVIDFGIAKALGQSLTDKTLFTGFAQMVGTPLYMSPEQAGLSDLDADTRSDVYSLGVLLYELLTGTTPFEKVRLSQVGYDELRRIIREEEPPRPSTRVSTVGQAETASARRGSDPRRLSRMFRGELDWVVMKALEKDRTRRYESAGAFAADVRRYLSDEPVLACPPSAWYRFSKFARRNRVGLAVAGLVLFFLLLLGGGAGWAAHARAARQEALQREVAQAVEEAHGLCRRDRLPEAEAAVKRAEALLAGGKVSKELAQRVGLARADVDTAALLEEVRLQRSAVKESKHDSVRADRQYRDAFRGYGLDVTALGADEAAGRIESSAIKHQLLAALDDWLVVKWQGGLPGDEGLLAVLRLADADSWRNQFRAAFRRGDKKAMRELARGAQARAQPPAAAVLVGRALVEVGERALAVEALRSAQRQRPDDFWINHALGGSLLTSRDFRVGKPEGQHRALLSALAVHLPGPGQAEAVGYYRAALALRPNSAAAQMNLGNALRGSGQPSRAIPYFLKAIELNPNFAAAYANLGSALQDTGDPAGALAAHKKAIALAPDSAAAHLNLGYDYLRQGNLAAAVAAFRKTVALTPELPLGHTFLGDALERQRDWVGARAAYQKAIAVAPDLAPGHSGLGCVLLARGDLAGAVAACQKAIALEPDFAVAHNNLGVALRSKRDLKGALAACRKAVALAPDSAQHHTNLGLVLLDMGDRAGAGAACRKAVALAPDVASVQAGLGAILRKEGDLAGAVAACRKAIALSPDLGEAHINLGYALYDSHDLAGALAAFRKAIVLAPRDASAHLGLGIVLCDRGNFPGALAAYRQALALEPNLADVHFNLGVTLQRQGDLPGAIVAFRKALALKPDYPGASFNLGWALRASGDADGAVAAYRKAIALKPDDFQAYNNLGAALQEDRGDPAGAIAAYRKAIALKPDFVDAHLNLGSALWRQGDLGGALAVFREAVALAPNLARAHAQLGFALRSRGDLGGAVAAYRKAISLQPADAIAHFSLGDALLAGGDLNGARAAYQKAIDLRPNYPEAYCHLAQVLRLQGNLRRALAALRRADQLGSRLPGWPHPTARWVKEAERLVELDGKLPDFVEGKAVPAGPVERAQLAELCSFRRLNRAAARFYEQAFAAQPPLADRHRYSAARAAALAGCGTGKDAGKLEDRERSRLRRQALAWLRADLDVWGPLPDRELGGAALAATVTSVLRHWLADAAFAGVRGPEALARLPEGERQAWQELWEDVARALARAQGTTSGPAKK